MLHINALLCAAHQTEHKDNYTKAKHKAKDYQSDQGHADMAWD